MKQLLAGFVAFALLAAACSGSTELEPVQAGASVSTGEVEQASLTLIAALGSDEAATDALIIAMDRGYSGPQILDAVDAGTLNGDGAIVGQQPAGQAFGLVQYSLEAEGEGATGEGNTTTPGEVMLVSFFQPQQTPIEDMRDHARQGGTVGDTTTGLILFLIANGFTMSDVIELLIFGWDSTASHPIPSENIPDSMFSCLLVDELYCPFGKRFPAEPPTDTDAEPAAPEAESAAGGDSVGSNTTVGIDAFYTGQATAAAITDATSASYEWQSVSFEAQVEGDQVELTVTTSLFIWWRGGDLDGEYTGDQNCGGLIVETLTGSGPVGSPTRIELLAASSELVEQEGALCHGDEPERNLHQIGDRVGFFEGQANGLGFSGEFQSRPAVFVTTAIALEAQ